MTACFPGSRLLAMENPFLTASVGVKKHECPVLSFLSGNVFKNGHVGFNPLICLATTPVKINQRKLADKGFCRNCLTTVRLTLNARTPG
ncbi:TPA: hypothetical protein JLP87_003986 [Escherichia coli]|nr:hypothetical protein [Escherichia coli]